MRELNRNHLILFVSILFSSFQYISAQNYSLYGVAALGGAYNEGVLYRYDYPSGNDTVILNFNGTNGKFPSNDLIFATDGNIYSATQRGGTSNYGVLYRINPITRQDTVLLNFDMTNGAIPKGGLLQASDGLLYGVTSAGGTYDSGLFYSYNIVTNTQTILFNFNGINGSEASGHLLQGCDGLIYGHTPLGGLYGYGVLYCYNISTRRDSVLFNFNGTDGTIPHGFMQASNKLIYGATNYGGSSNEGVLYSYNPTNGAYTVLENFTGPNGVYPCGDASSLFESSGRLYGIAQMGGTYNNGLLYAYNMTTSYDSIIMNFDASGPLGQNPTFSGFTELPGDLLITPVDSGGLYGMGTLLSYNTFTGAINKLMDFNGTNGALPNAGLIMENSCQHVSPPHNNPPYAYVFTGSVNGICSIEAPGIAGTSLIKIYNMLGQEIFSETLCLHQNHNIFNFGKHSPGIYLYRISSFNGGVVSSGKFVAE